MKQHSSSTTLLRDARIVSPRELIENAALLITDGRITDIIDASQSSDVKADIILDLQGAAILPGFIDIHIHGAIGVDVTTASADEMHKVACYLASRGTTAWLPTLVPARDGEYAGAVAAMDVLMRRQGESESLIASSSSNESSLTGARAVGVHYEGPFVNKAQCGALRTSYFKDYNDARDLDFMWKLASPNAVHFTTIAPEIPNGIELTKELIRRGFIVSIGHTRADVGTLDAACAAGARHVTHLFNAMTGLHHRAPGVVGWALAKREVTCDVIADLVHVDALALDIAMRCKGIARMVLISDAVAPTGLGDGEYRFWDETIKVKNGRTENERGGIAGSVITILDAVRVMLKLGVSLVDVAQMAATNPAHVLGIGTETGSIETGKRADLVAIDDAGNIRLTMIGGRVAFVS